MNRDEYIKQLRIRLSSLDQEEINSAISFYEEYFDEAGVENEQKVMEEMGNPTKLAAQIKAESIIKNYNNPSQTMYKPHNDISSKDSMKKIWIIVLGILASPIALPLGLALVILLFSLALVILCFIFVAFLLVVCFVIVAIVCFIKAIFISVPSPENALLNFGVAITSIGISILGFIGFVSLKKIIWPKMLETVTRIYEKMKNKGGKFNEKSKHA